MAGRRNKQKQNNQQSSPKKNYKKEARRKAQEAKQAVSPQLNGSAAAISPPTVAQQAPTPSKPCADGSSLQTMQQQRARYALEAVQTAIADENVNNDELKSYASGLPAMIQMNGLGQAAAFYFSQGGTHQVLYDILSRWLTCASQPYGDSDDLLAGITTQDMHSYRVAQAEALLLLDWVKKFAKAYVREARP